MSGIHWWKKEVSLRRPRGTVVVAKPVVPADLIERAAALFDQLETDLSRSSLHEHVPTPATPPEPVSPGEPAGNASPALPAVWPQALVDLPPQFYAPVHVPAPVDPALEKSAPTPEPEPQHFAELSFSEAAYSFEPEPA